MTNVTIVDVNVDVVNALIDFKSVSTAQSLAVWPWLLKTTKRLRQKD